MSLTVLGDAEASRHITSIMEDPQVKASYEKPTFHKNGSKKYDGGYDVYVKIIANTGEQIKGRVESYIKDRRITISETADRPISKELLLRDIFLNKGQIRSVEHFDEEFYPSHLAMTLGRKAVSDRECLIKIIFADQKPIFAFLKQADREQYYDNDMIQPAKFVVIKNTKLPSHTEVISLEKIDSIFRFPYTPKTVFSYDKPRNCSNPPSIPKEWQDHVRITNELLTKFLEEFCPLVLISLILGYYGPTSDIPEEWYTFLAQKGKNEEEFNKSIKKKIVTDSICTYYNSHFVEMMDIR